ncbi:MAG: hypothetical protein ACXWE3_00895 [Methylobacter sp.]
MSALATSQADHSFTYKNQSPQWWNHNLQFKLPKEYSLEIV